MSTPLTPADLLTPTGTPITRTATWWAGLLDSYDDATDTDSAGLPLYDPETVDTAMDRVADAVLDAPHLESLVTIVFTAKELDEVFPLGVPGEGAETDRSCRVCGCTDLDCRGCIERTGQPCFWVEPDLCSACVEVAS